MRNKMKEQSRTWRKNHPERAREISRNAMRRFRLRSYGFTATLMCKLKKEQKGLCAFPSCKSKGVIPDHNHINGAPRGLLCRKHNIGLGFFNDNIKQLKEAIAYLQKYQ
jgi:hypothetical protein